MTPTHSLTLPADCRLLSLDEAEAVVCGASSSDDGFSNVLSNIEKISKVFNYMVYGSYFFLHQLDAQQLHHHLQHREAAE